MSALVIEIRSARDERSIIFVGGLSSDIQTHDGDSLARSQERGRETYGIGMGIGSGRRIFLPPLRSIAVSAAFLSIFFLPASTWPGLSSAAITTEITSTMAKTLKYFILAIVCVCVCCCLCLRSDGFAFAYSLMRIHEATDGDLSWQLLLA